MSSLTFSHVAINCKDPLAVERFYTRYFDFTRARVIPLGEQQIVFIKCGTVYLEIFSAEGETPSPVSTGDGPHTSPAWRHIAFQVDSAISFMARSTLVDDVRRTEGLALCGRGAPCPG